MKTLQQKVRQKHAEAHTLFTTAFDTKQLHLIQYNAKQLHKFDAILLQLIRYNAMQLHLIKYNAIQLHLIQNNAIQLHSIRYNAIQLHLTQNNAIQLHSIWYNCTYCWYSVEWGVVQVQLAASVAKPQRRQSTHIRSHTHTYTHYTSLHYKQVVLVQLPIQQTINSSEQLCVKDILMVITQWPQQQRLEPIPSSMLKPGCSKVAVSYEYFLQFTMWEVYQTIYSDGNRKYTCIPAIQ